MWNICKRLHAIVLGFIIYFILNYWTDRWSPLKIGDWSNTWIEYWISQSDRSLSIFTIHNIIHWFVKSTQFKMFSYNVLWKCPMTYSAIEGGIVPLIWNNQFDKELIPTLKLKQCIIYTRLVSTGYQVTVEDCSPSISWSEKKFGNWSK